MFQYFRSAGQTMRSWFTRRNLQPIRKNENRVQPRLELLEDRLAPATFAAAGTQLNLDLNVANTAVSIISAGTIYNLTLTGDTWSGTDSGSVTGNGTNLLKVTRDVFDTINLTDSAVGAGVTFANSGANAYSDSFNVALDSGPTSAVQFTGSSSFTLANSLSVTTTRNITMNSGSSLKSADGNITLSANQQTTPTSGNFVGILVQNGVIQSTGAGIVTVSGNGGDNAAGSQFGVAVRGGGSIRGGLSNQLTVQGTGGASSGSLNAGVIVADSGSQITSGGGAVLVAGAGGGTGSGGSNNGVLVNANGKITNAGTGAGATVTVTGVSGATSGNSNTGVAIAGVSTTQVSSSGGAIAITGQARSTSAGSIAFQMDTGSQIVATTGTPTVTIIGDSMAFFSPSSINAGTNTVVLKPRTAGTLINLGGSDSLSGSPLRLGLTDGELDTITARALKIGDANSGDLTVSAAITRPAGTNVELASGGNLILNQNFNTAGGTLLLTPGAAPKGVQPKASPTDVTTTSSTTSFGAGSNLAINVAGTTVNTQYDQLNVSGTANLTGVNLSLTGSYTSVSGNVFTIVSATSVSGTFNGLADNALITFNGGRALRVNYTATTVTLTDVGTAPTVTLPTATSITSTTALLGGTVTSAGLTASGSPASITQRGVLYAPTSVNPNPTIGGAGVIPVNDPGTSLGTFTDLVSGLQIGTGYSFVAFATTSVGTGYSSVATFTTLANTPPVVAADVAAVSANEGGTVTNTGTFSDAQGNGTVTITASIGTATQNNSAGTWSWSLNAADGPASPFTVTITATDNQNAAANTTFTYAINNVPPTISLSGNATVNEGSPYTLNLGVVTDPGQDTITSYKIAWGDGTFSNFTGNPANTTATHTYADGPNNQTHTVTVTDEDGTFVAGSLSVLVKNVDPTIALTGNSNVNEGSLYTLNLGAITDPGTDTVTAYSINWGDGPSENFTGNPANTMATHTYADGPNSYTITVSLTDEDGTYPSAGSLGVTVDNVDPTGTADSGSETVDEGDTANNSGTCFDPGADPITLMASVGSVTDNGDGTWSWSFASTDGPNESQTVTIYGDDGDGDGAVAIASFDLTIDNVAPTIAISGASNVNEGSPYSLTLGAVTDPGTDTVSSYIVHWGDSTSDTYATAGAKSHTYADGTTSRAITVDLVDEDGTFTNAANALSVSVDNVDPTATANSYTMNQGSTVSGNVMTDGIADSDPAGANDPLTVTGYTQPANGTVTVAADGSFTYTPATTFSGTDSFTYSISDGDGGTATATVTIVVNAAAGGSITTVADTCLGGTALLINGTSANDSILVEPGSTSATLNVTINGVTSTVARPSGRIIVMGGDGDDNIQIAGAITNSVWLYGEAGNDRLNAGNASPGGNLLFGGDGNDDLTGGSGRDIMIGGQGADKLVGNASDDILIAGLTAYDSRSSAGHEDFWCKVMHEWTDPNIAFLTRVNNLRNGTGATGANLLANVFDDYSIDQIDMLQGSSGNDWFIFKTGEDKVVGQTEASN